MFEGFAALPDVRLWYWDTGGAGESLVLCHPGSQSCRIWEYQRETFADAGYRVVAYSRRGHFRSELGSGGRRDRSDRSGTSVGDLRALLDHLGIERAHVLGAAAGGITALALAVAHPERVLSLALAGTIFALDEDEWRTMYARLGIAALHGVVPVEFLELGPAYRASNPSGTARFVELAQQSGPPAGRAQPSGVSVTFDALALAQMPVLLMTGEADLYAPPPLQVLVAGHLPDVQCATFPSVGHAPYWEVPTAFNAAIVEFLSGRPDARA